MTAIERHHTARHRAIFLSDIHLGTRGCQAEMLLDFLGFDRVKNAVENARGSLDRARLFMCTPERKLSTFREHQAIVAAIKRRDANTAVRAMEAHLDAVMTELVDFAERNPGAVSVPRETAAA